MIVTLLVSFQLVFLACFSYYEVVGVALLVAVFAFQRVHGVQVQVQGYLYFSILYLSLVIVELSVHGCNLQCMP